MRKCDLSDVINEIKDMYNVSDEIFLFLKIVREPRTIKVYGIVFMAGKPAVEKRL